MGETTAYIILRDNADLDRGLYVNFSDNPPCGFGGSGVVFGEDGLSVVPDFPHHAICPLCKVEIYDSLEGILAESSAIAKDFTITCASCRKTYGIKEINSGNVNWYIAKNYIYISGIDEDEWAEDGIARTIRATLPGVVGVILGYDT